MTKHIHHERHWVGDDDWPFDHDDEGIDKANRLAPEGWQWARVTQDSEGYILLEYEELP